MNHVLVRSRSANRFRIRGTATAPNSPRETGVGLSRSLTIHSDTASKSNVKQTVPLFIVVTLPSVGYLGQILACGLYAAEADDEAGDKHERGHNPKGPGAPHGAQRPDHDEGCYYSPDMAEAVPDRGRRRPGAGREYLCRVEVAHSVGCDHHGGDEAPQPQQEPAGAQGRER